MIVSTKGRYALLLMTELAKDGGSVPLRELAERQNLPYKYAENIVGLLVRAGFLESRRGKAGGYSLVKKPEEYTLAEILKKTETSLSATECTGSSESCPHAATCPTLPVWRGLDETVDAYLSQYTLVDLMG